MTEEKQLKTRIDKFVKKRFKKKLGDTSMKQFINGVVYDYLNDEVNEKYYETVNQLHELETEKAEIAGELSHVKNRIGELKERRDRLESRRDEIDEEIEEIKDELEDFDENATNTSDVEDVAYDLLVKSVNGEVGTNGVLAGVQEVQRGSVRADTDPEEIIETMREMAEAALESEHLQYIDDPLDRSFRSREESTETISTDEFNLVRLALAEKVVDEEDVDREKLPEVAE